MSNVIYKIQKLHELIVHENKNICFLDWDDDFNMINQYYIEGFQIMDLLKDDPGDFEVDSVCAYVMNGKIYSMTILYKMKKGEIELGAVSTHPEYLKKGYCKAMLANAAEYIIKKGYIAALTTADRNIAMQKAAESIGMKKIK